MKNNIKKTTVHRQFLTSEENLLLDSGLFLRDKAGKWPPCLHERTFDG